MDKMIVIENDKKYILTNVKSEMYEKQKQSCDLCDYHSKPINCRIYHKYKCPSNHCYKLVKEEDMNNKGKCPECGSVLFTTEKRPNGDSVCSKCNFSGKTTEFYKIDKEPEKPKMKSSELSFKLITNSEYRNKTIIALMRKIGFSMLYINQHCCAFYVNNNNCGFFDEINSVFENMSLKEVTFDEAVKLIESCEPLVKKSSGKFIEYDIDGNGYYNLESGGKVHWQEYTAFEIAKVCIFAGWFWVNPDNAADNGWSLSRQGINRTTKRTSICEDWEYPLVPTKIRFWVKD